MVSGRHITNEIEVRLFYSTKLVKVADRSSFSTQINFKFKSSRVALLIAAFEQQQKKKKKERKHGRNVWAGNSKILKQRELA